MAKFVVETTHEEQESVLNVLKQLEGQTTPVEAIANRTGLRPSRVRYVLMDLIDAGKIEKVPTRAINKHYVRYTYKIL